MKQTIFLAAAWALVVTVLSANVAADSVLSTFTWKKRVLIIDADRLTTDPIETLESRKAGILERHIVWFMLSGERVVTNAPERLTEVTAAQLRATYFAIQGHALVVIGKDGGVKRADEQLDVDSVFALIDGMPMRQRELQR